MCEEMGAQKGEVTVPCHSTSERLSSNAKSCLPDLRACALNHLESLCFLKENDIWGMVLPFPPPPFPYILFSSSLFILLLIIRKHCRCPGLYLMILTLFLVLKWRILLLVLNTFDTCWQLGAFSLLGWLVINTNEWAPSPRAGTDTTGPSSYSCQENKN